MVKTVKLGRGMGESNNFMVKLWDSLHDTQWNIGITLWNALTVGEECLLCLFKWYSKTQYNADAKCLWWCMSYPQSLHTSESRARSFGVDMDQGPVVRRPISANPGLNFNLRFFIPLLKSLFGKIFSVLFKASSSHTLNKKNSTEFSCKALRTALNNPAQDDWSEITGITVYQEKGVKAHSLSCNDSRRKFFAYVSAEWTRKICKPKFNGLCMNGIF